VFIHNIIKGSLKISQWYELFLFLFAPLIVFFEFLRQSVVSPECAFPELGAILATIFASWYIFSCFIGMKKEQRKSLLVFLKPNLFLFKLMVSICLFISLAAIVQDKPPYLNFILPFFALSMLTSIGKIQLMPVSNAVLGIYVPFNCFSPLGLRLLDLVLSFTFLLSPLVFYVLLIYCKKIKESYKKIQQLFQLDLLKTIVSIFLYILLSFILFKFQPQYYFPFYNWPCPDVLHFLIINFILGWILIFFLSSGLISILRKRNIVKEFKMESQFFQPNWDKILILLILFALFGFFNISLSFAFMSRFSFFLNFLSTFLFVLFWHFISCLIYNIFFKIYHSLKRRTNL